MSSVALKTPSNGSITLTPVNTASNLTVTVPAVSATMLTDSSGILNIGAGQIYKDASGNVGIGVSVPERKLDVRGNSLVVGEFRIVGTTNTGTLELWGANTVTDGAFSIKTQATRSLTFTDAYQGLERMRIDASGNVGIGTSSPYSFDANTKALTITGATGGAIRLRNDANTAFLDLQNLGGGGCSIGTNTTFPLIFKANSNETMRLASGGEVAIGTTAVVVNGLAHKVIIAYPGGVTQYGIGFKPAANDGRAITFANAVDGTVGMITTSSTATTYNTTSDYRLKENVQPMTGALETVAQLKPCTYTWKADGSPGQGFIAHELQVVVPACVTGEKDATTTVEIKDETGNVTGTREQPDYQGVDTSFLVATLVSAIQEQQTLITHLQADVAALKGAQ